MPLTLLLTRHGQTADNLTQTLQGHRDTSLTPAGHSDAQHLATKLRDLYPGGIDAIYHSPLLRIRQTVAPYLALCGDGGDAGGVDVGGLIGADACGPTNGDKDGTGTAAVAIGGKLPLPTLHGDPDLKGQYLGVLEGQSYDSIDMSSPRSADDVEGVEVFDDFVARLLRGFGRIVAAEREALLVSDNQKREGEGEGEGERERVVMIATHGVGITSLFKAMEASAPCDGFGAAVARRGDEAWEVRWTDADDVARVRVERVGDVPVGMDAEGRECVDWDAIRETVERPFVIEVWGKEEKKL